MTQSNTKPLAIEIAPVEEQTSSFNFNQTFCFESQNIRIIIDEITGEIWFNAKDICNILEHSNPRKAVLDHVDSVDVTKRYAHRKDSTGRIQRKEENFVNESGLYALIFSSKLPKAIQFKRWVTSEVLPSIRKTGAYISEEKSQPKVNYTIDPNLEIQLKIAELEVRKCAERLADRIISTFPNLQDNAKQQLLAHAYSTVTQSEVTYLLPLIEKKTFTATELAEKYGKSPQTMGKILNLLNLKSPEFSECRLSKSKYSDKQVEQYFYFETVLSILDQYFQK